MPFISATQGIFSIKYESQMIRIAWSECVLSEWKIGMAICDLEFGLEKWKKLQNNNISTQTRTNRPLIGCSLVQSLETDVVVTNAAAAGWWSNMFDGILCNFPFVQPCICARTCISWQANEGKQWKICNESQNTNKWHSVQLLLQFNTEINTLGRMKISQRAMSTTWNLWRSANALPPPQHTNEHTAQCIPMELLHARTTTVIKSKSTISVHTYVLKSNRLQFYLCITDQFTNCDSPKRYGTDKTRIWNAKHFVKCGHQINRDDFRIILAYGECIEPTKSLHLHVINDLSQLKLAKVPNISLIRHIIDGVIFAAYKLHIETTKCSTFDDSRSQRHVLFFGQSFNKNQQIGRNLLGNLFTRKYSSKAWLNSNIPMKWRRIVVDIQ